jgi:hypothetical protein
LFALPRNPIGFLTLFTVRLSVAQGCFAACGQRRGLLALDLGSIFKKLLHQKTFILLRSATVIKIDFWVLEHFQH